MSRGNKDEPAAYPITQAELAQYQRLERQLQQASGLLGKQRRSLMARMGGPARVEPGPLTVMLTYHETGLTTTDDDGEEQPVLARRLIVTQLGESVRAG